MALWPTSARALECDPALPGPCSGSDHKDRRVERPSFGDLSSSVQRRLGIYRPADPLRSSGNGLQMAQAEAAMPESLPADRVARDGQSRSRPGVDVKNDGGDKASREPSSMNPAPQPGSAALIIAGMLGIFAVARRRISSILG